MQLRTDLALEAREFVDEKEEGVVVKEEEQDGIKISEIKGGTLWHFLQARLIL